MIDQLAFLQTKDEELYLLIRAILKEELEHLAYAEERIMPARYRGLLTWIISTSTDLVIWLSTQGDVTRMKRAIA